MSRNRRSPGFKDSYSPSANNEIYTRHKTERNPKGIRSLCLSNIPLNISDANLCKAVNKEFSRYGEFQVSITNYNGERVAYLNYMRSSEAQNAMDRMQNFEIDSKRLNIRPIYIYGYRRSPRRSRSPVNRNKRVLSHNESSSEKLSRSVSPRLAQKEKLPQDNIATRTLFVGNLPNDISEDFLYRKFDKYGIVRNIDIKRQANSRNGIAYAFIRYATLDMAVRAKHELDDETISGQMMKIGFGKPTPSTCIWVGGLGPWLTFEDLEREIVRLGSVSRIEWPRNKNYAYIIFHSLGDAVNAIDQIKAMKFADKRINADFTELSYFKEDCRTERSHTKRRSPSRQASPSRHRLTLENARSTQQVSDCLKGVWAGKIILKKNKFGCRFYKFRGDESLIDDYLFEERQNSFQQIALSLNVTQVMLMDRNILRDIRQRMDSLKGKHFCVLFATSYVLTTTLIDDALQPPQPIKLLIEYLKTKNSSGVILLPPNSDKNKGTSMLHIFPPCDFVFDILREKAPSLSHKSMMDDFLLILLLQRTDV